MKMLTNYPKLHCPFIRKVFDVNKDDWEKYGHALQLREPKVYLVVDEITPNYEWVFDDKETIAIEKLDGTNVKIKTEKGRLTVLQNRKNIIDPLLIMRGKSFMLEGIFNSIGKGYINQDGEQVGEIIGPKLQGNPYKLNSHLWYPFSKAIKHLKYRSFHEHDRTFNNWDVWFKNFLPSLFTMKRGNKDIMAEGIVFYNLKRESENKLYRAKLRRNMFPWFYEDKIEIYNYPEGGRRPNV